jgi:sulfate transport system substrate-binding protein
MFRLSLIFLIFFTPLHLFGQQADLLNIRKELDQKKGTPSKEKKLELLNVSYDPTREFYESYNTLFSKWWKEKTNQEVFVVQSHGGSGKQARSVISGLEADVVTLALAFDIDYIQKLTKVVGDNWQERLPNHSTPYYSTIVFLVRLGNPKKIHDWNDLVKPGVAIVAPNPKTSGGARWIYMAAWAYALKAFNNDPSKAKEFLIKLYGNAPLLNTGARESTTSFIQRNMGDVLLTWENEAYLTLEKTDHGQYEIIYPSTSIQADPPVTWINTFIKEKGTEDAAKFYLKYLYSLAAQELIAKYHFRPYDADVAKKYEKKFPNINLVSIKDFGGWEEVQKKHFSDNGLFDEIFLSGRKKQE